VSKNTSVLLLRFPEDDDEVASELFESLVTQDASDEQFDEYQRT
jgi:hypothetical protein